jgi:NAD(P)-dependent dehydrogenase (short-subunit alcohol dehydrogenase family)
MKDFSGKLAVITGAGTGMGRELARKLAAEGCHLALCDVQMDNLGETRRLCEADARHGGPVTVTACDVSVESQVLAFRDAVLREHATDHVHLLFNNAGIGGGGSFVSEPRDEWDKTFAVCWGGVYLCTRAFLPLLIASEEAHLVNTSSINGFWACLGPRAHTAYSAAKFAVKGFTEALLLDLRLNAPHVKVSLVMPGHIGTPIVENSRKLLTNRSFDEMTPEELAQLRRFLGQQGIPAESIPDADLIGGMKALAAGFENNAPTSAAQAADVILDGVRSERWRVLVGADAEALDRAVRDTPEEAYERSFLERLSATGQFQGLLVR